MQQASEERNGGMFQSPPLKVPAIEIIDLSSDTEEGTLETKVNSEAERDALSGNEDVEVQVEEEDDVDSQWSMYEDLLNADDSDELSIPGGIYSTPSTRSPLTSTDQDACTLEESLALRKRLRLLGEDRFLQETIECGAMKAKKLITAFNIHPPLFLEGSPDTAYYTLVGLAICRELSKRQKLPQYNTLNDVVTLLHSSKNIIVLTGAGISTSLGIPDFRSKHTGLYAQLGHLGLSDPQEVFDISLFREDPSIFYSVAKDILPTTTHYSPTHAFIRLLQDKNKLLTNFTQNIDNLETHAGIDPSKLLQCHGSFATATCIECGHRVAGSSIHAEIKAGKVPRCDACLHRIRSLQTNGGSKKRKRSSGSKPRKKRQEWESGSSESSSGDENILTAGVLKPDITFFGEALPPTFHDRLLHHDRSKVDLVLVIGTSLKVAPVSEVVGVIPATVPQVYISREACSHVDFDVDLLGDCDTVVTELCRRAGWDLRHEMCGGQEGKGEVQVTKHEGWESRWDVRVRGKGGEGGE